MTSIKDSGNQPSFRELLDLVRKLPTDQQRLMAEELRRTGLKAKWNEVLDAFEPNSISDREIVRTCKTVRRQLIKKRHEAAAHRS